MRACSALAVPLARLKPRPTCLLGARAGTSRAARTLTRAARARLKLYLAAGRFERSHPPEFPRAPHSHSNHALAVGVKQFHGATHSQAQACSRAQSPPPMSAPCGRGLTALCRRRHRERGPVDPGRSGASRRDRERQRWRRHPTFCHAQLTHGTGRQQTQAESQFASRLSY
jgi:hypothetical protein